MNFNIASSGLSTAQKNIDVISNNIANETTEGYRRQVLSNEELPSINKNGFNQGSGSKTGDIHQTVDNIIYGNMLNQLGDKSFSDTMSTYGKSIENLYQDNNGIGINTSLENIFSAASDVKNNMENKALEAVLIDNLNTFNDNLHILNNNLSDLKTEIIKSTQVDINDINKELADLQVVIKKQAISFKPELADKQATLEQSITSKIDAKVVYDKDGNYNLLIGHNRILDKNNVRELSLEDNKIMISDLSIDITNNLSKGSISAKAKLALADNNEIDKNQLKLDLLAKSVIEEFNSAYSNKAFQSSKSIDFKSNNFATTPLLDLNELNGINPGNITFNLHSDPLQSFTININHKTTMESIKNDIETQSNNEIRFSYDNGNNFSLYAPNYPMEISEEENTNFKKSFGFNKILEGNKAKNINVKQEYLDNPDKLFIENDKLQTNTNYNVIDKIVDLQYKEVNYEELNKYTNYFNKEYFNPSNTTVTGLEKNTIKGFYTSISISASRTVANSTSKSDLQSKIYETTLGQYENNTMVDKDTELLNLMKYQAAYSANAKVITTMNELMDTILRM